MEGNTDGGCFFSVFIWLSPNLSTFNRILLLPPHLSLYIRVTYILTRPKYDIIVIYLPLKITVVENSVSTKANQLLVIVMKKYFSMVWQSLAAIGLRRNYFQWVFVTV